MKKQRLIQAAVIFVVLGFFLMFYRMGFVGGKTVADMISADGRKQETQTVQTGNEEKQQDADTTEKKPLTDAFTIILNETSCDFYQGYAIDESFLLWLQATCGEDAVEQIAQELQAGNADTSLWHQCTGRSLHVLWLEYCSKLHYSTYLLQNVRQLKTADTDRVVMDFVGDINLDDAWYTMQTLTEQDGNLEACIAPEILQELQSADLTMINNEFTYSLGGSPLPGKAYTFRANPENVNYLKQMGADIVSLGNNHVCDYGDEALLDTFETLKQVDIDYVGAGRNLKEASAIRYYVAGGYKIAIVSATQIERSYSYTKQATETSPGVLKTLNPEAFCRVIEEADASSDLVIAYVHWGTEGTLRLQKDQRTLAESYVDAGADLIIGNHSHRLQGVEYVEGVPVINSLGNFWFSNGDLYAAILQVVMKEDANLQITFLPCRQQNLTTRLLTDEEEKAQFYQYIADLSEETGLDENGRIYPLVQDAQHAGLSENLPYQSGRQYGDWTGNYDLSGHHIDIVGNY